MPKIKTRKIALKRFKITKTGKILHRIQGQRHLRRNKSKSKQRDYAILKEIDNKKFSISIKRAMGE
jgi:large subunit ribosomal protein L35